MAKGARMPVLRALLFSLLVASASTFYLPGIAPADYGKGAKLDVFADKITSVHDHVPYDYFTLAFCKPSEEKRADRPNLGEILLGERDQTTAYEVFMLADEPCKPLCRVSLTKEDVENFQSYIRDEYMVDLNVDNMPFVMKEGTVEGEVYSRGTFIGWVNPSDQTILYNHLNLKILYHKPKFSASDLNYHKSTDVDVYRVVGFEGYPASKDYDLSADANLTCAVDATSAPFIVDTPKEVLFTYSVKFEESDLEWGTRWDPLLQANPDIRRIQWFSILNTLALSLLLTFTVAGVLMRTVYLDFNHYNNLEESAEIADDSGWKQVRGDVFRPPFAAAVLSVLVGSGTQVAVIVLVTLIYALLGFLSPANRGALLSSLLMTWMFTGYVPGYVSARLFASMGGIHRKLVTLGAAFFLPLVVFSVFLSIDFMLWIDSSSAAVSFLALIFLLPLWFIISVPLCTLGSVMGYRKKEIELPCRINAFHRPIPEAATKTPGWIFPFVAGTLPFMSVFIELIFILGSLWQDEFFYMFGFLFAVFIVLAIMCAEVSLVVTYMRLSKGDYHWWWRSFFSPATSGLYVFLYSIYYLLTQPDLRGMHFTSFVLYLGYMFICSLAFFLMTGAIGFHCSFWFTRKMFSSIHLD